MTTANPELERFRAQRVTAIYRLDLISKGAQITYEDRRIEKLEREAPRT